ncbi:hypothetical protein CPB84DRAFT_1789464 [Gymnopilus junonius]|uniref:Uncharacterized protein n=1 Tax=Gymnopilus junonius TaxID=109634 RepID=A0A9P5NG02_GYMJU|nr:hypothetical protein CPB84DRAFT_1789464 [Gymnopilus junonius]
MRWTVTFSVLRRVYCIFRLLIMNQAYFQPRPPTPHTTTIAFPRPSSHSYSNFYHNHHHPNSSTSSLSSNASATNGYGGHQFGAAGLMDAELPRKKGSVSSGSASSSMVENERKRYELQLRVWRARIRIPGNAMLKVSG